MNEIDLHLFVDHIRAELRPIHPHLFAKRRRNGHKAMMHTKPSMEIVKGCHIQLNTHQVAVETFDNTLFPQIGKTLFSLLERELTRLGYQGELVMRGRYGNPGLFARSSIGEAYGQWDEYAHHHPSIIKTHSGEYKWETFPFEHPQLTLAFDPFRIRIQSQFELLKTEEDVSFSSIEELEQWVEVYEEEKRSMQAFASTLKEDLLLEYRHVFTPATYGEEPCYVFENAFFHPRFWRQQKQGGVVYYGQVFNDTHKTDSWEDMKASIREVFERKIRRRMLRSLV